MDRLKSRKFWLAVVSALSLVANEGLGLNLPTESIMSIAAIAASYILGQGVADAVSAAKLGEK